MNTKRRRIVLLVLSAILLLAILAGSIAAVLGVFIWNRNTKVELAGERVIELQRQSDLRRQRRGELPQKRDEVPDRTWYETPRRR